MCLCEFTNRKVPTWISNFFTGFNKVNLIFNAWCLLWAFLHHVCKYLRLSKGCKWSPPPVRPPSLPPRYLHYCGEKAVKKQHNVVAERRRCLCFLITQVGVCLTQPDGITHRRERSVSCSPSLKRRLNTTISEIIIFKLLLWKSDSLFDSGVIPAVQLSFCLTCQTPNISHLQ